MLLNNKLVREICDDDSGYPYLADARKKLIELRKINQPHLTRTYMVDGFTIRVEKHEVVDNIFISGDKAVWASIASTNGSYIEGFQRAFIYQLAVAPKAKGQWKEPPATNADPVQNSGFGILVGGSTVSLIDRGNLQLIQSTGDGRYVIGSDGVGPIFRNKKRATLQLVAGEGEIENAGSAVQALTGQLFWRKNPKRNNTITLQSAIYAIAVDPILFPPSATETDVKEPALLIKNYDVDYLTSYAAANGTTKQKNTTVVKQIDGAFYGDGTPLPFYLTPYKIIVARCWSYLPTRRYIATSTDGGYTWTLHVPPIWGSPPNINLGPHGEVGINGRPETFAALNGSAAARMSYYVFDAGQQDPNAGVPTTPGDFGFAVHKIGIDGSETLLHRFIGAFDANVYAPARDDDILSAEIYALGKDCLLARLEYQNRPTQTLRLKFSRSYDGGTTWDEPNTLGWERQFNFGVGLPNIPPAIAGIPYPRKPYVKDVDGGEVYVAVTQFHFTNAPYSADLAPNPSELFLSTDQCRTFKSVAVMSHKTYNYGNSFFQPIQTLAYDNVCDSSAPIDPIFPWRLDERVTPPDWW